MFDDNTASPAENQSLRDQAEELRIGLITFSTGGQYDEERYREIREALLAYGRQSASVPKWIRPCRTLNDFWSFIAAEHGTYQARRQFLREQFEPLLVELESQSSPIDDIASDLLRDFSDAGVSAIWSKALARIENDPEGAITAARTLLESTCKQILDKLNVRYASDGKLAPLYDKLATTLKLSANAYSDERLRAILEAIRTIVLELGSLRNEDGDAHGRSLGKMKPLRRHAALCVNLAGSAATFLIETYNVKTT